MQNQQYQNHRLIGETSAPGERVTLAPQSPADCDRLTVDERGVYILPAPRRNLTVVIARLEARAAKHERGSFQHTFFTGYAANHRATLARLQDQDPDDYRPEPDEEAAHVGYVTPQLGLQD